MAGRPKKTIPVDQFEKLCHFQATEGEICEFFELDHKTLYRWCRDTYGEDFSQVYSKKRAGGKMSLRRKQWRLAEKSPAMAIFLGKNYLGQCDQQEVKMQADIKNPYEGLTDKELRALAKLEGAEADAKE